MNEATSRRRGEKTGKRRGWAARTYVFPMFSAPRAPEMGAEKVLGAAVGAAANRELTVRDDHHVPHDTQSIAWTSLPHLPLLRPLSRRLRLPL